MASQYGRKQHRRRAPTKLPATEQRGSDQTSLGSYLAISLEQEVTNPDGTQSTVILPTTKDRVDKAQLIISYLMGDARKSSLFR